MNNYETAAIKIHPAELTREIMRSADVQLTERLRAERVEQRKNIRIAYLCDGKACTACRSGGTDCKHTTNLNHAKNYKTITAKDLVNNFDFYGDSQNELTFIERE